MMLRYLIVDKGKQLNSRSESIHHPLHVPQNKKLDRKKNGGKLTWSKMKKKHLKHKTWNQHLNTGKKNGWKLGLRDKNKTIRMLLQSYNSMNFGLWRYFAEKPTRLLWIIHSVCVSGVKCVIHMSMLHIISNQSNGLYNFQHFIQKFVIFFYYYNTSIQFVMAFEWISCTFFSYSFIHFSSSFSVDWLMRKRFILWIFVDIEITSQTTMATARFV